MTKWFALDPCDESFLRRAPFVRVFTADLPVSAERAWTELTSDGALSWCRLAAGARYTSPRPFGVGTTRELTLKPSLAKAQEHYFLWEEEPRVRYRNTFYIERATAPGLRRFGEDSVVEQTVTGCRFTWTFAIEGQAALTLPLSLGAPVLAKAFQSLMKDTEKYFARL